MRWKLFANLAEAAGAREVEVSVDPGGTVGDALDALLDEHPDLEPLVLDDDGDLRDHIRLLHNGENPFTAASGYDTSLDAGDELALFPPVSGG
ncbi:molybdopterin synthase sulfur carrier subunit [Halobacteriales archaeon QS_1_68_17]|nr:MAG: molybdopterin synthase sulfur carrier subunit [Halobacteriales archaeon QS_1_68_17]